MFTKSIPGNTWTINVSNWDTRNSPVNFSSPVNLGSPDSRIVSGDPNCPGTPCINKLLLICQFGVPGQSDSVRGPRYIKASFLGSILGSSDSLVSRDPGTKSHLFTAVTYQTVTCKKFCLFLFCLGSLDTCLSGDPKPENIFFFLGSPGTCLSGDQVFE